MSKSFATIDQGILKAALQGLKSRKRQLDDQIALLHSLLESHICKPANAADISSDAANRGSGIINPARRVSSPEARERIVMAQKKRWAAFRENKQEISR
jgi:hypothetical protein